MAWIHCGLDSLWFGLIVVWLKSDWPTARGPSRQHRTVAALLARVKIYYIPHPYGLDSLWLGFIVVWINYGLAQILIVLVSLSLFNWVWFSKTYVQYETS